MNMSTPETDTDYSEPIPSRRTFTILFIGGSYGGLTSMKFFIKRFIEISPSEKDLLINVYLIDPRAGFLNILGIPRAIIDVEFAKVSYLNVEDYNLKFESVESTNDELKSKIQNAKRNQEIPSNLKIHFIHGKCISFIDNHTINYQLNEYEQIKQLKFDYAVFSTGRRRTWPVDPKASTEDEFATEMAQTKKRVVDAQTITVIGAGALGIEVAGEIKETYNGKHVRLIHPHSFLPPEIFATDKLKNEIELFLKEIEVDVVLNTRVSKELEDGTILTTDGRSFQSDLNFWCNSHKNNIEPLLPVFQDSIDLKQDEVIVDERLLMKGQTNIFVIGDVVNCPIVKTAGAAYHQGEKVASSIINIVVNDDHTYEKMDLKNWPKGMTIVVGSHRSVTQWNDIDGGDVKSNDESILGYYEDYCTANTKRLLNISN